MKQGISRVVFACTAFAALSACGPRHELSACNVAERTCQEDVYYTIVRLRGDGWDPFDGLPPIRTITVDQYRDELEGNRSNQPEPDEEEEEKVDPWGVALQWLGLVTLETTPMQASVDNRVNNVAAYYSSRDRRVTVIDRGQERNDPADTILLAHELVHAFQDNEISYSAMDSTSDGSFAGRARIEGEAVLYESLARAEMEQVDPQGLDWEGYYTRWIDNLRNNLPQEKSPFYAASWFVYPLGAEMLMRGWLEGGNAAVRTLTGEAPRGAGGLMARHERRKPAAMVDLTCAVDAPGEAFRLVGHDRFGAMQVYAFLAGNDVPEAEAWDTALAWRGDEFWLYFDEESEQVGFSWRIRLASADAALRVVETARTLPMLRALRDGADALIVGTDVELEDWPGAAACE